MKLNQQQAPLYGQCIITVQLNDDELAADAEGVDYFLLFAGTTQRHLTSTRRTSHDTLQAVCPAHDCCEEVLVTLCSVCMDFGFTRVAPLAEHRFFFVQDLAFDMAQFLVSTAGRTDALDGALLLDECQIPLQECERLDESLALALHHLVLPPGWSLLGNRQNNSTDLTPQETLLHFSARRGLYQVTHFLLKQPGANEALTLANRQGHTPSTIAASCGHDHLYELLNKVEPVAEAFTHNIHRGSSDVWVVCNLPRLNTHSLSLRTHPGCEFLTLKDSVEQLLHHLHAKGGSGHERQFDHLHTAAECCDAVETEITCAEELQHPAGASTCLDIITGDSCAQKCLVAGSNTDVGCGETESAENNSSLPVSDPNSEVHSKELGLFLSSREQVCLSFEEREDTPQEFLVFTQNFSVFDTSDGPEVGAERANVTLGVLPPTVCGKQAVETDREAAIWEVQEAVKGEDRSEQEEKLSTARRREEKEKGEEESNSESTQLITTSVQQKALVMGQSSSSEALEPSENSDSEIKDCSQEEMNPGEERRDGLPLHENEGLTDPGSASGEPSHPRMTDCGDVIEQPEAAFSCFLIEGLLEGEPPPDTNSLEQHQETAGWDYLTEEQGLAGGVHSDSTGKGLDVHDLDLSFDDSVENSSVAVVDSTADSENAGDMMEVTVGDLDAGFIPSAAVPPNSSCSRSEQSVIHGHSSDEDASFKSLGSSTTEIFHPTEDNVRVDEQYVIYAEMEQRNVARSTTKETNGVGSSENEVFVETENTGILFVSDGSHPEPQLESLQSFNAERTKLSNVDPSDDRTFSIVDATPDVLQPVEYLSSEIGSGAPIELDNSENSFVEDKSFAAVVASESDHEQEQPVETSLAERPLYQGLDGCTINPSSKGINAVSESAKVEASSLATEATRKSTYENDKFDAVDGAWEGDTSPVHEGDVVKSEVTVITAWEEENHMAEETDFSTIHRDKEASFHQPCNSLHSESPPATVFPSLPSRTSSATSSLTTANRDSGCDVESYLNTEPGYDSLFKKSDEAVTGGDSTSEVSVSCSSTDDTTSVGPSSSSLESSQGLSCSWSTEEGIQTGAAPSGSLDGGGGVGGGGGTGEADEEAKDRVTEVPLRSCLFRNSLRSLSPPRRHSWGPGKNNAVDAEMNQRSYIRSPGEGKTTFHRRSYSLEGLSRVQEEIRASINHGARIPESVRMPRHDSDDRGSLVSLTEEQEDLEDNGRPIDLKSSRYRPLQNSSSSMTLPLTKSVSMLAISQRDIDGVGFLRHKKRISFSFNLSPILSKYKSHFISGDSSSSDDEDTISMRSFCSTSGSLAYSISEEEPGPLRTDTEEKSVTKVSRTFSYLKNKMYKKTREKDREKKEKDKDGKEKDKKTINGHLFTSGPSDHTAHCSQCNKTLTSKEAFHCAYCNSSVHKGCRDNLPVCSKVKMKFPKQPTAAPDSSSIPTVTMRNKSGGTRERPWSAILSPEDHSSLMIPSSRRPTSIMPFHGNNLSKSLSISNIAGPVFDEMPIKGLRYLSQSTDSLNRTNQVTESMESLTDEGTEMMDGQLMGEFECEAKELEADSWSLCVEQQYLQHLDREVVKRQDVIYELMQTEMHHIRTLRIMSEVYSKGLQKELQLELQTLEKLFPALDELLEIHTQHLLRLLERKRECQLENGSLEGAVVINRIGDILISQFSGTNGESMRRIYGRFCSRHNEAVNFYKDLITKDKRFKAFIKKKMSSSIVRRLSIPECILLVTQRITKYPVLVQRMLQHTAESEEDYDDLTEAIRLVKEVIAAVDSKVNEHEKKQRLKDFHSRMDSKSIMMMKNGQIFAREDMLRRRLIHDGTLQLKNIQGRLKDVHALLLSDVFVFLQEKDQKYVYAMLDQRSTVISLQKLIIREVANEERGLFLITAGIEKPEMIEVLASSKDERNTWMQLIQNAMHSMEKDEDEGIPSESEDDKRQLESKAKEMRDLLRQKDTEIMSLLEEKVRLFRGMWEGLNSTAEACLSVEPFFRSACSLEPAKGASIMKNALQEVEKLQALVNGTLGGAMASAQEGVSSVGGGGGGGGGVGPVCLPRRAETFGGFDSHQMHGSKSGDRDEGEDTTGDLRRTESDGVLKKGGNANLLQLLKRNSEHVLNSVTNLHVLLSTLQAVVVQQDSFIEEQRQALCERSSSSTPPSRQSSRPSSLIEQEKQRSLEKQRQELASLQRQQAAHADEKRRREREWELREQQMTEREALVHIQEEEVMKQQKKLEEERRELQSKKEEYQRDLERLRDAQKKLERDTEAVKRQIDRMESERTPSTTSDESHFLGSSQSLEPDPLEFFSTSCSSTSSFPPGLQPQQSKPKGKGLNPFTLSSTSTNLKSSEANNQISKSLLQLAKNRSKEGKEKKKKKEKGGSSQTADTQHRQEPPLDGEIFFC